MSITNSLRRLSPPLYRLRLLVVIVAVVTLPFAFYYLLYVRNQASYYTDRNFRKLSAISTQVASRVETACGVFKNTSDKFINPLVEDANSAKFNPKGDKQENLENLKEAFKNLKGDRQIIPISINTETWTDKVSADTVTLGSVKHENESSWLYLEYLSEGVEDKTVIRVQAKLDLNRLIQPFLSTRVGANSDQFQNVLIAESDTARVIFQQDSTQVRIASLDKLQSSEDQAKKIDLKETAQTSHVVDVSLAGSNYRLFSHPLKLNVPSSANAPGTTWITSGLVKSSYFQTETWSLAIPYKFLIIGAFVVALVVFSWPFLKLVLSGPKDRFRPKDVYFLIFATMAVLAVLTCFGLYVYVYTSIDARMNRQVASLASDIKKHFDEELRAALDQLDALRGNLEIIEELESKDEKGESTVSVASQNVSEGKPGSNTAPGIYQQGGLNKTGILPDIKSNDQTRYPYFDAVVWIDSSGMQRAKWGVKNYNTQYISVAGRPYFDNIRKERFYELGEHKFWLQPVISKNTGRNQIEISKKVEPTSWVLALDTRLLSLLDPVLPRGFGYAIITNDGKALFHSDEAHHLNENLFQESDDDPNLRSAVIGRSDKALTVRYLGEDHSFFVTTLNGFPEWSLVVFRKKQPLRSIFFDLLTAVTVLFLIYGLVLMAGFSVFIFNAGNDRRAWLWPTEKNSVVYIQSVIILLGLSALSVVLILRLHGEQLVWLIAGVGVLSGFAYFVNLRWGSKLPYVQYVSRLLDRFKVYDRAYVLNVSLLLFLVAILPAGAFFKYAYESQVNLFIKHAQYSLAIALAKREERIRNQYSNIKITKEVDKEKADLERKNWIDERLSKSWDVYDTFFFETSHESPRTAEQNIEVSQKDLLVDLNAVLPLFNQDCIERRGLLYNASVAGVGKWEPAPFGKLVLRRDGDAGSQGPYLSSSVPLLDISQFGGIEFFVLLIPLYLFLNPLIRRVFLLDVQKPASHSLKKFLSEAINRNVFVVVDAPFVKKVPINGSNMRLKTLPGIATSSPDWADAFDDTDGDGAVIALDQFDYRVNDPQLNKQKLKLVEKLLENQKTLMIFSSVESSKYSFSSEKNGDQHCEHDDKDRWTEVIISNFSTEYAEDTDDGKSFKKKVDLLEGILTRGLKGKSLKKARRLFETLYFECAPRGLLQRCGLQIIAQEGFITMTRNELIERIASQARTYYSHIWNSCSINQKLTLCHLAQDRLLSYHDPDVEQLLRRELIVRDEDLRLFNESFRRFVRSEEKDPSFVVELDKEVQQGSLWQTVKVPILVGVLMITGFVFVTQQDLFSSSLALVTGLTTLIPAVLKLVSLFHTDSIGRPSN